MYEKTILVPQGERPVRIMLAVKQNRHAEAGMCSYRPNGSRLPIEVVS